MKTDTFDIVKFAKWCITSGLLIALVQWKAPAWTSVATTVLALVSFLISSPYHINDVEEIEILAEDASKILYAAAELPSIPASDKALLVAAAHIIDTVEGKTKVTSIV